MLTNPTYTNAFCSDFVKLSDYFSPGSIVDALHLAVSTPEVLSVLGKFKNM